MLLFLQDDEYRGKGTTGIPYFDCGRNNAMWLSMDMVVYPPPTAGQHVPHGNTSNGKRLTGTKHSFVPGRNTGKQHKPPDDSTGKQSTSQNTTTGTNKSSRQGGFVSNAGNMASNVASKAWTLIAGPAEIVEKDQQQYPTSKMYKVGDRVVIYSMKTEQPIRATVRWTGLLKFSRASAIPSVMVAGLETVSCMSVWFMYVCMCILLVCVSVCSF